MGSKHNPSKNAAGIFHTEGRFVILSISALSSDCTSAFFIFKLVKLSISSRCRNTVSSNRIIF